MSPVGSFHIYVPSKGRAGQAATLAALASEGIADVTIVTPADEVGTYHATYAGQPWDEIAQDGKGIGPARQTALDHARERGVERFWLIDDDTRRTFIRLVDKRFRAEPFGYVMELMADTVQLLEDRGYGPIDLAGPQFRHRAWSGPDTEWDKHLRNFILIRTDAPANYWPWVKEDLDFTLQVLTQGHCTLRFNSFAFETPDMGSTQGGCFDDYLNGALDHASATIAAKWPGIVEMRLNQKHGYIENRINWREALRIGNGVRPHTHTGTLHDGTA